MIFMKGSYLANIICSLLWSVDILSVVYCLDNYLFLVIVHCA